MVTIGKKSVRAGKFVDSDHVDTVVRNYKQHRWAQNSERLGKADSLSVWFSVEDIEAFLEKAKEHGGDGVRFYFGAYDEQFEEQPLYAGRQTIVMVATKNKETLKGSVDKNIYINTEKGSSILAFNVGRICPPMCTDDGPGGGDIGITIIEQKEGGMIVA